MKQRVLKIIDEVRLGIQKAPELTHLGNPVLRQKTKPVTYEEGVIIANKLINILDKYKKFSGVGAGLAASQIGLAKKVFVTTGKNGYEAYINPKVISFSKKTNYYRESCLSSRTMWCDVARPVSLEMEWTDITGKKRKEKFTDFKARLIQHEYDHTLGIPCLDKAVPGTVEYSGNVKGEKLRSTKINVE